MNLSSLGHEWALELLEQQIILQQVHHAYLFTGPDGVGRRTLALQFAQRINCSNPPHPGQACESCRICTHTKTMQQIDMSVVQAEKAGSMLKVDQIRALQHSVSLTPTEARFRIGLILDFDQANPNAQNALLKTLEEAPERVILLLTATSAEELLPTIVSRCQLIKLRPLATDTLKAALIQHDGLPESKAAELAHLTGGRAGAALHLAANPDLAEEAQSRAELFFDLIAQNYRQRFSQVDGILKASDPAGSRQKLKDLLQSWIAVWRDALICAVQSNASTTYPARAMVIRKLTDQLSPAVICSNIRLMEEGLLMLEQNVNPRLLLENILLNWPKPSESAKPSA